MPSDKRRNQPDYATLPNSVEAEQNLLCCIMRNTDMQLEIISQLQEVDFYQVNHREIFAAMSKISSQNRTVNFTSVVDYLRRNGKLTQVGDVDYITRINDLLPSTARYEEYIQIVRRASDMRKLIEICGEVTKRAYGASDSESVIAFAEEKIFELGQKGAHSGLTDLSLNVSRTIVNITERYIHPESFHGLETGYYRFDNLTNGLHGGELIVLAARPGVGKSALAMNIVENVAKQGKTVAVFSLEMSNEQIIERMLAGMAGIPLSEIKSGKLSRGELDVVKLQNANNVICSTMHLYGNDNPNVRPGEIRSQCRRLKAQHDLDLVVIDYIGLMQGDESGRQVESRQNEVSKITRALKIMAKELDVPVLALSQLKRDAEIRNINAKNGESEPVLSDLRESGAIEQDADIVLFIHREKQEEGADNEKVSLIVAKHRNGETAKIPLQWIGKYVRFVDERYFEQYARQAAEQQQQQEYEQSQQEQDIVLTDDESQDSFVINDDENDNAWTSEQDNNE